MKSFKGFLTIKEQKNKEHLHLLQKILEKAGFQVENHLDDGKEPYIYIRKPVKVDSIIEQLSFGGVRLYTRGRDIICYRAQNKAETEPFGTSYQLDVEGMFKDLIREKNKDFIGNRIIFYVIKELKEFFVNSARAEKEEDTGDDMSQMGVLHPNGTDYSDQVFSNNKEGK